MPAQRPYDLPTFVYHHETVTFATPLTAVLPAGSPISFARTPVILPATPVWGVTEFDCAIGDKSVTISVAGIVQTISGAAFVEGDAITFDATGRAIKAAAGSKVFGHALTTVTAAGSKARVFISRGEA